MGATNVQDRQRDLQGHERVGAVVDAPYYPENVAQKEAPEARLALPSGPRPDEPGGHDRHDHRGPLDEIDRIHSYLYFAGAAWGAARARHPS